MATPFGGCQVRPPYSTGGEIVAIVLHHAEKGFVGPRDSTIEIPHDNPHNIGLDQTPNLGFQPTRQLTDFCFRLFALGHLNFELFYVCQCLIRGRRKFPREAMIRSSSASNLRRSLCMIPHMVPTALPST